MIFLNSSGTLSSINKLRYLYIYLAFEVKYLIIISNIENIKRIVLVVMSVDYFTSILSKNNCE